MEKHFCNYNQSLALKELGFDMPCLASWNFYTNEFNYNSYPSTFSSDDVIQLPLKSQVFEWFRKEHHLYHIIHHFEHNKDTNEEFLAEISGKLLMGNDDISKFSNHLTYEEAESVCIDKLIELIKQKL